MLHPSKSSILYFWLKALLLLLFTLYEKGKTQVVPVKLTHGLGTFCVGTLVSANLRPDPCPDPTNAIIVIKKAFILLCLRILNYSKEGMFICQHFFAFKHQKLIFPSVANLPNCFKNCKWFCKLGNKCCIGTNYKFALSDGKSHRTMSET